MVLTNRKQIGSKYESLAKQYLLSQGLTFIEGNFLAKCGEIDLIMKDQQTVVFVEVRYRKSQRYGHAAETVTPNKMKKLVATAKIWLQRQRLSVHTTDFRFDVIALHQQGEHIEWIQNAITEG